MRYTFNGWEFGFNNLIDLKSCEFSNYADAKAFGEYLKKLLCNDDDDVDVNARAGYMIDENENGYDFESETAFINGNEPANYGIRDEQL